MNSNYSDVTSGCKCNLHSKHTQKNYSIYIKGNEKQVFHHRKSTKHKRG